MEPQASQNLRTLLIRKAQADPAFKASLLADPAGAIAALTGARPPEGVEVVVVEESPARVCLVLPFQAAPGELTGAELENVAGGGIFDWATDAIVGFSLVTVGIGCAVVATVEKCGG